MEPLLASAYAKLNRADETAKNLEAEIRAFLAENPEPYRIVGELKNENKEYVFIAFGELVVPSRFAILFGEVMYQLRTALDHLLSALVHANGGAPNDRQQFPICSTPEKFIEAT